MRVLLFSLFCLCLNLSLSASESTVYSDRGNGEMVIIAGESRADLISRFDFLKSRTEMVSGTVFVKDTKGNIVVPEEYAQAYAKIISEKISEKRDREGEVLRTAKAPKCPACSGCGVIGPEHGADTYPAHGKYQSCQACPGCLTPPATQ
jgi:hypothetical protein